MARVDSSPRERLIEAGMRLLEHDGPEALRARRVTAEAGASTMAVYTYFGGMAGLVEAIVAAAFERFGAALEAVAPTDDPMADFFVTGYVYRRFALADPQRYRLMFGLSSPQLFGAAADLPAAGATFGRLVETIGRIVAGGRIRADDVVELSQRVWSMIHGVVLLEIVGQLQPGGHALTHILGPMTVDMFVGMGDDRAAVEASLARAVQVIAHTERGAPR